MEREIMSAENWTKCPQCGRESLPEYYEVGIYNGKFNVNYSAKCRYDGSDKGCGFKFSYKHSETFEIKVPFADQAP
jgi:hypothetical protein